MSFQNKISEAKQGRAWLVLGWEMPGNQTGHPPARQAFPAFPSISVL